MKALRALLVGLRIAAAPIAAAPASQAQVFGSDVQMASSAIMNAGNRANKVKSIKRVPSVGVIRLDFFPTGGFFADRPDPAEFRIMVSTYQSGVNKLRQALRANPVTREALAKRGISPNQVAGAQISTNGSLRLYIFMH